jgi:hypothetical protein
MACCCEDPCTPKTRDSFSVAISATSTWTADGPPSQACQFVDYIESYNGTYVLTKPPGALLFGGIAGPCSTNYGYVGGGLTIGFSARPSSAVLAGLGRGNAGGPAGCFFNFGDFPVIEINLSKPAGSTWPAVGASDISISKTFGIWAQWGPFNPYNTIVGLGNVTIAISG